ncbi:MAG: autotransporter domain-containing protein, partial [Phycisphaeraceae bacterium]
TGGLLNFSTRPQTIASIAGGGTIDIINAAMTVGDANDTVFSGNIIGLMGSVTKVGTGNLTLSGVNTYSGATTISEGTLTLDGDLQNDAAVTIATGATLDLNDNDETLGTISGPGSITLGSATLTVGNAVNFTFGGTISETGGLTKAGTGTLTLSGAQTYTGATTVNSGTLIALGDLATSGVTVNSGGIFNLESTITDANADVTVNSGGTLFGTGTIGDNLTNNGTITFVGPGLGDTLTVNGDYTQGSTGTLNIQLGNAGGLVITGAANLDGTLNIATPADPANFDISATYDVLTAGSITGNFATVTDEFVFLDLTANNVGGNVRVSLARNATALNDITQTANQTSIANILDSVGPTGELDDALSRILASSESGALATLDQLAGGAAATASTQAAANAIGQSHRLLDQVVGVRPGTSRPLGAFGPSAGPLEFDDTDHITLLSFAQDAPEEVGDDTELDFTPWASIYGGFGDQGDGAAGLDYTRYGLLAGLDLTADESDARYGLSLGIEQTEFDLNSNTGEIDIQSIYLAGYASQPLGGGFKFSVLGALGYHSHDSQRTILIGATPTRAQADFDSYSVSFAGEISKAFNFERIPVDPGGHPTVTTLEPFVRLDYSISSQDGYSETGAGTAGLNVNSEDFDSSRIAGGLRVEHQYMIFNQSEATLRGNALVSFALANTDSALSASFVNTPGSNFEIVGADQDDVFGQIGVGLSVEINDNWDMHFDIDQQFSDSSTGTVIAGMLSYEF